MRLVDSICTPEVTPLLHLRCTNNFPSPSSLFVHLNPLFVHLHLSRHPGDSNLSYLCLTFLRYIVTLYQRTEWARPTGVGLPGWLPSLAAARDTFNDASREKKGNGFQIVGGDFNVEGRTNLKDLLLPRLLLSTECGHGR